MNKSKFYLHLTGWLMAIAFINTSLVAQEAPFSRGVNLTNWFQASSPNQIQFTKYTLQDFENIKSLGCDVIRLPINLHAMTSGGPDHIIKPLFWEFLDEVVKWAEALDIHLILDNHTFDPAVGTDPNIGTILEKVWSQMAEHYKNSSQLLYYEILNEPHDISDQQWNAIQQRVVEAIRAVDKDHFIIVGPANWNSFHNLDNMPTYNDDRLIYTFHYYEPFVFTHQGATWVSPSMGPLAEVPFPYNSSEMPPFPDALRGSWIENAFNDYSNTGNAPSMTGLIDIALQFKNSRNLPLYCGEFGVYIPNSNNEDRVFWYEIVRQYLEDNNIAWTTWDYHGGFGLFEEDGNDLFRHDLNVPLLEALGFNVPDQSEYLLMPERTGFPIYTDYVGSAIVESSFNEGEIDFYSRDLPNNDKYCLSWTGAAQFNNIGFDLKPDKDLSILESEDYALDLMIRGNAPVSFDVRFIDSDQGPEDHPWRMRVTIDESMVPFDSRWHHLYIPLKDFSEHGAWEDQWFPPEGKFDWSAIDRFEIVAEHEAISNAKLWFDNLQITNMDTARVHQTSVFEDLLTAVNHPLESTKVKIYPNPVHGLLYVESRLPQTLSLQLLDGMGREHMASRFFQQTEVDISRLPKGFYMVKIKDGKSVFQSKVLKL